MDGDLTQTIRPDKAISEVLDRVVAVAPEADVPHHDEGPVSVITTAALRQLGELVGQPVDPVRFRANLLVDTTDVGFVEDEWLGHTLNVGPDVVLVPRRCLTRCVMIDLAQEQLPHDGRLLKTLTTHNATMFGVWATVEREGRISIGDRVTVSNA